MLLIPLFLVIIVVIVVIIIAMIIVIPVVVIDFSPVLVLTLWGGEMPQKPGSGKFEVGDRMADSLLGLCRAKTPYTGLLLRNLV